MAQEHQEYIQTKVNPTLENMVTQVLLERPEKPVPFMIRWLADQTKAPATIFDGTEVESLRDEIRTLQAEVAELEAKLGDASVPRPAAPEEEEDEDEDEDDDFDDSELQPTPVIVRGGHRQSVSAQAHGIFNPYVPFTPPVIEKPEDQLQRIREVIGDCILFKALSKSDKEIVALAMVEVLVPAGERVIQEGDEGELMYVVDQGSFDVYKNVDGKETLVKHVGNGDFFGELALLYNCPRAASVQACEESTLWQLDRETFNHIVRHAAMTRRQRREAFLESIPMLETLTEVQRSTLADSLHEEHAAAGAFVICQGDEGDRIYIVEEGELVAQKMGPDGQTHDVFQYGPGSYFGELALIRNQARDASVLARTESSLLWVDRRTFKALLGGLEGYMEAKALEYERC